MQIPVRSSGNHAGLSKAQARRGLTLVEFLVLVGIVVVLIALLLPAILAARRAALRVQCANRLRQIGIALQGYATAYDRFPYRTVLAGFGSFTSHKVWLLPQLDLAQLFNAFNTELGHRARENATVSRMELDVFLCPFDQQVTSHRGWFNYTACVGDGVVRSWDAESGEASVGSGLFSGSLIEQTRLAACVDGLSHTAAYAEVVHGGVAWQQSAAPEAARLPTGVAYNLPATSRNQQAMVRQCTSLAPNTQLPVTPRNPDWTSGISDMYNHLVPPGNPSCIFVGASPGAGQNANILYPVAAGVLRASSRHGSVNVLFGDGHVRAFSGAVDQHLWRAIGTCDGRESLPKGF